MKQIQALLGLVSLLLCSAQYIELALNKGDYGDWKERILFPQNYLVCGVELRNQEYQGFWGDDSATNGVRFVLCRTDNWSDQKEMTVIEGHWGDWKGMKMCSPNTFVTGASVKYETIIYSQDDHTSINGLKIRCTDLMSVSNSATTTVYFGLFGNFLPMVPVPPSFGVCGAQVQSQDPQGGGNDDTALNAIKFLICSVCADGCETCTGLLATDCLTCQSGLALQPDKSCSQTCPPNYFDFNRVCVQCDSACNGCDGLGPSKCLECSGDNVLDTSGICTELQCGSGQFESIYECEDCLPHCEICDSSLTCTQCQPSYYLSNNGTSCVPSCNEDDWADEATKACLRCPGGCGSCSNNSTCTSCSSGFFLSGGGCYLCNQACESCSSPSSCSSCLPQFVNLNGACVSECPPAYFESESTCVPCPPDCESCSGKSSCSACSRHFFLSQTGECLSQCPSGFFRNQGKCTKCSLNCLSCDDSTSCTQCQQGYIIGSNSACTKSSDPYSRPASFSRKRTPTLSIEQGVGAILVLVIVVMVFVQMISICFSELRKNEKVTAQTLPKTKPLYSSPVKDTKSRPISPNTPLTKCEDYSQTFLYLEILTLQTVALAYHFKLDQSISFLKFLNIFNGVFYFIDSPQLYLNSALPLALFCAFCLIQIGLKIKRANVSQTKPNLVSLHFLQIGLLQLFSASKFTLSHLPSLVLALFYVSLVVALFIRRLACSRRESVDIPAKFQKRWFCYFILTSCFPLIYAEPLFQLGSILVLSVLFTILLMFHLKSKVARPKLLRLGLIILFLPSSALTLILVGHSSSLEVFYWGSAGFIVIFTCLMTVLLLKLPHRIEPIERRASSSQEKPPSPPELVVSPFLQDVEVQQYGDPKQFQIDDQD